MTVLNRSFGDRKFVSSRSFFYTVITVVPPRPSFILSGQLGVTSLSGWIISTSVAGGGLSGSEAQHHQPFPLQRPSMMTLLFAILWIIFDIKLLGFIQGKAQNNGLVCLNDYIHTISCEMNTFGAEPFQMENTSLEFLSLDPKFKLGQCVLRKVGDKYGCELQGGVMMFNDGAALCITLHTTWNGVKSLTEMYPEYILMHHIKPSPPRNLTVVLNSGRYEFAWDCGYDPEEYLSDSLKYKLVLYKKGQSDILSTYHPTDQAYFIEVGNLEPGVTYSAKVCSGPLAPYKGNWSDWSNTVSWSTEEMEDLQKPSPFVMFGWIACLGCVVSVLLLLIFLRLTASLKIKTFSKIPTPAPYFQPLYSMYKGNFKNWLLYPSYMGEPFKMDELLKIDTLTEAKPCDKPFPVPPLHLTKCQVPYVSHLGNDSAIPDEENCSESPEMSSKKALSSQSLDLVGPSEDNSGCKDLILSLANKKLQDTPPQEPWNSSYHDDYCTLADTTNGLFPAVRLTKTHKKHQEIQGPQSSQVGS
ncbi:hypothetical protein GN956_G3408 [Arapaima gigas]